MSDVPRVARSVDDLRVGMVVAWQNSVGGWHIADVEDSPATWWEPAMGAVILADPPARDWLVPATQMEALREALGHRKVADFSARFHRESLYDAARAVLDAAREVEHE